MRRPLALVALVSASAAVAPAGGCCDPCDGALCGPCPPMLTITVKSSDGRALSGVATTRAEVECFEATASEWSCSVSGGQATFSPGDTIELDVTAPGFQPSHVTVTVPPSESEGCCSCGYLPQTVAVQLAPL